MKYPFTTTGQVMRLLARLYKPLDITDNLPLIDCTLSDRVSNTAAIQEQEQVYLEYTQTELNFKRG